MDKSIFIVSEVKDNTYTSTGLTEVLDEKRYSIYKKSRILNKDRGLIEIILDFLESLDQTDVILHVNTTSHYIINGLNAIDGGKILHTNNELWDQLRMRAKYLKVKFIPHIITENNIHYKELTKDL